MKSGALQRIWIVFVKEVLDNLRDRRTLATALITPLIGPIILGLSIQLTGSYVSGEVDRPVRLPVIGSQYAPTLVKFLGSQPNVQIASTQGEAEKRVREGKDDFVLVIGPDYGRALRAGRPAPLQLVADSGRVQAAGAVNRVRALLSAYSRQIASLRLIARGIDPNILQAVVVEDTDVATSAGRLGFLLGSLPLYLLLAAFIGGLYVAIDTTTGERERGSLEPLVINPVARSELIVGKLSCTIVFTLLVVLETVIALAAVLNFVNLDELGLQYTFEPGTFVGLFLLTLPIVLLAAAALTILASFSRTFKEAQSYLTLVVLLPTFPSALLSLLPLKSEWWTALIPVFSQQLLMSRLLKNEPLDGQFVLVSTLVTLALGLLLAWAATRVFDRESVV